MRKTFLTIFLLGAVMLAFSGCAESPDRPDPAVVVEDPEVQNALIEITARRLAYHVALNNPEIIEPGQALCFALANQEGGDLAPLLADALKRLDVEVEDDPLLASDLATILALLKINLEDQVPLTERQRELIEIGARAFSAGLAFAKKKAS